MRLNVLTRLFFVVHEGSGIVAARHFDWCSARTRFTAGTCTGFDRPPGQEPHQPARVIAPSAGRSSWCWPVSWQRDCPAYDVKRHQPWHVPEDELEAAPHTASPGCIVRQAAGDVQSRDAGTEIGRTPGGGTTLPRVTCVLRLVAEFDSLGASGRLGRPVHGIRLTAHVGFQASDPDSRPPPVSHRRTHRQSRLQRSRY